MLISAAVLVNEQAMVDPAAVASASSATEPAARFGVAVPPDPRPVHVIAETE
jgi:hypothetical protein